jgi:acyl carrier protein
MEKSLILDEVRKAFTTVIKRPKVDFIEEPMTMKDISDEVDSVTFVEVIMVLEDNLGIVIPETLLAEGNLTIGGLVDYIHDQSLSK